MSRGEGMVAGRLVLDDRVVAGRLVIESDRIAAVELESQATAAPYVAPGFVDVHVHGSGGYDAMAGPGDLDGMARYLLRHGVTSFLPTAITAPLAALRDFAEQVRGWRPVASAEGAEPLGFNLEGPFLSPKRKGAQNPAHLRLPDGTAWDELAPLLDGLRLTTVAPELPGALDLIRRLVGAGVMVSLGHSDATAEQAAAGYAAGALSTTHLFNAMSPVDQHAPGLAVAALTHDGAYTELIVDGNHVDRSLWPLIRRCKPANRLVLVSDAIRLAGAGDGRIELGGLEVEVRGDRATLAGTTRLAGSVISLDLAVHNLVAAGWELPRAVAAAGQNPLSLLGIHDRGRLAPGQRADLVLLDQDLQVLRVMRAGRWADQPVRAGYR
ncbi:MAG TPA: N-acetylglucosamine-6-phosphate deacetylase [Candidatus Sulfotelmatobacter sp.]|nr:N-acetylglucosamine-6-phosphate deacetylase [Candidatus Sulfotelmatobacter sp.]